MLLHLPVFRGGIKYEVQHDHYVVAAATMELGLLYILMEKIDEAERQLDIAK